jgi:hypothetical protein
MKNAKFVIFVIFFVIKNYMPYILILFAVSVKHFPNLKVAQL